MNEKRQKRATVPLKKGTVNCTVHMTSDLRKQLGDLAEKSGKRIGEYCRAILENAALRNLIVVESLQIQPLREEPPPYRTSSEAAPSQADARSVEGAAAVALKARLLKPQADAPSDGTASPSNVAQKRPNPRPKLPTPAPK